MSSLLPLPAVIFALVVPSLTRRLRRIERTSKLDPHGPRLRATGSSPSAGPPLFAPGCPWPWSIWTWIT